MLNSYVFVYLNTGCVFMYVRTSVRKYVCMISCFAHFGLAKVNGSRICIVFQFPVGWFV